MSLSGAGDGNLFETNMSLRCEIKALKRAVEEYKNGKRYLKIQKDHSRVVKGYIKEIGRLKKELCTAHAQAVTVRNMWTDECDNLWQEHLSEMSRKEEKIRQLEDRIWEIQRESEEKTASLTLRYENQLYEQECVIKELENKLAHAEALLGRDSTNTNLPTGQTPPDKKRYIPNSRRNTGKRKGGQPGHEKSTLKKPSPDEITDEVEHPVKDEECCPTCGSDDLVYTGEYEERYEIDIEVNVKKMRHKFFLYQCGDCGEIVRTRIDPNLWAECQYGPMVQATALSLMNTTNAPINKTALLLSGMTEGEVCPSGGYIAKLMKRAAGKLDPFMSDLFKDLIKRTLLYWDDTVVMADKKRICLRFYGDEDIAYYVAHDKKDMDSIVEDGVLDALTNEARVMHDHNSINYNDRFCFLNLECNAHLQRDLKKTADETGHAKPKELKELISTTIKDRNDLILAGGIGFEDSYVEDFEQKLTDILSEMEKDAVENKSIYSGPFERALVNRLHKYRENYFAWVRDFTIPTTNNLAERALRGVKTKMKVAGQFSSSRSANYYAKIRSYIETCRRNGINEITALLRLCKGNPFTVEEIFSTG